MKGAVAKAERDRRRDARRGARAAVRERGERRDPPRAPPAEEIWNDTDGGVDNFVAGIGTGGTITGVGQVLKERKPGVQIVARRARRVAHPQRRHARPAQDPGHRRRTSCPRSSTARSSTRSSTSNIDDADRDGARASASRRASSAASRRAPPSAAALEVAKRPENAGKTIVVIVPSFGERYLSTVLYEDLRD